MKIVLLDSNIIIYAALPRHTTLKHWLTEHTLEISEITRLEVLGFHLITQQEMEHANRFFSFCRRHSVDIRIIDKAIELRQEKKMSLGDSLIAATAILQGIPLATVNIKDFDHLPELELINPLAT